MTTQHNSTTTSTASSYPSSAHDMHPLHTPLESPYYRAQINELLTSRDTPKYKNSLARFKKSIASTKGIRGAIRSCKNRRKNAGPGSGPNPNPNPNPYPNTNLEKKVDDLNQQNTNLDKKVALGLLDSSGKTSFYSC